jgi:3-methyladenine DNA glycosylase AlkD
MAGIKNARDFLDELKSLADKEKARDLAAYFQPEANGTLRDILLGVGMGQVFSLANDYQGMPLEEIDKLLESPIREARVGAASIMDGEARNPNLPKTRRKELFELYVRRHERFNAADIIDRAAPNVVGGYLFNHSRDVLDDLARSEDPWRRRTAIAATYYFIRQEELDDTFRLAEIMVHDPDEMIQKAVGGFLREAGRENTQRLLDFLNRHAAEMPREMLKRAVEDLEKELQDRYLEVNVGKS